MLCVLGWPWSSQVKIQEAARLVEKNELQDEKVCSVCVGLALVKSSQNPGSCQAGGEEGAAR